MKLNIEIIEAKRKANNMSVTELSRSLGLTRQAVFYILKKRTTSLDTVDKLTKLFNLKVQEILIQ